MLLKALALIATYKDDDILYQIGCTISAQQGSLAPRYHDLLPTHPMVQSTNVERPDIVQSLQPVSADEYPVFVLVEHRCVACGAAGKRLWS